MSTDSTRFASPRARENNQIRRTQIAPLLAAGMSLRDISAATGIPMGAVHRAKRQLEKSMAQQATQWVPAASFQLPVSYLVKKNVGGVPQQHRRLTVSVNEHAVETAIGRGLLGRNETGDPWGVLNTLFAAMFEDHTIAWLNKRGYLRWDQRGQGNAIIAAVNALIWRQR
jgi:hypothetical protein